MIYAQVFQDDIKRLLSMTDMWRMRKPPTPLDRKGILAGSFVLPDIPPTASVSGKGTGATKTADGVQVVNGDGAPATATGDSAATLKDQQRLTLSDTVRMFDDR